MIQSKSVQIESAWADRVAGRLRSEFGLLIQGFPATARTATGMARWLKLQVPLCHRLLAGVRANGVSAEVLGTFPGIAGQRKFLAAARDSGANPDQVGAAGTAVDEFEALIGHAGGSQRRLVEGLSANVVESPVLSSPRRLEDSRKRAFEGMVEQLGCRTDLLLAIRAFQPAAKPRFEFDADLVVVAGRVGFSRQSAAMPQVAAYVQDEARQAAESIEPGLFEDFCSKPLPKVSFERRGTTILQIFDAAYECTGPMDSIAGPFCSGNLAERNNDRTVLNGAATSVSPAEYMLNDVYLPRAWAQRFACSAHAFSLGSLGVLRGSPGTRWFDRLPQQLTPGLLGRGIAGAGTDLYPRHQALTKRFFEASKLDPGEFVGYRSSVAYPVLFAQYVLSFEQEG